MLILGVGIMGIEKGKITDFCGCTNRGDCCCIVNQKGGDRTILGNTLCSPFITTDGDRVGVAVFVMLGDARTSG